MAELAEIDDEIEEENLPEISGAMKAEAERILRAVTRRAPAPTVYPAQDAEIALHFKSPDRPGAVLVLLRDDRRAECHAYVDGKSRYRHYETSADLSDAFVLDRLDRLSPGKADLAARNAGLGRPG